MATDRLITGSQPRNTVPKPPAPMRATIWYLPIEPPTSAGAAGSGFWLMLRSRERRSRPLGRLMGAPVPVRDRQDRQHRHGEEDAGDPAISPPQRIARITARGWSGSSRPTSRG